MSDEILNHLLSGRLFGLLHDTTANPEFMFMKWIETRGRQEKNGSENFERDCGDDCVR